MPEIGEDFREVGRMLWEAGLVSTHGGNMSVGREGGTVAITRTGCPLGRIENGDLVTVAVDGTAQDGKPSMDTAIHRTIYRRAGGSAGERASVGAVIHAHPGHAIALSLVESAIEPQDLEGKFYLGSVPVVAAEEVAQALESHVIAVVRGHGSYAWGADLWQALQWTSVLEESAQVLWLWRALRG